MSALIKPGRASEVRPFALAARTAPTVAAPAVAPAPDPRDAALAQLQAELDAARAALAEMEATGKTTVARARAEGRAAGLADAETRENDRLKQLATALTRTSAEFSQRIDQLDGLAAQLVRAVLTKLFAAPLPMAGLATSMLARQLDELGRGAIVSVRVSSADFADADALQALASALAIEGTQIAVLTDPELGTGACGFDCKLGRLDLDVREQWAAVAGLLDSMSSEPLQ